MESSIPFRMLVTACEGNIVTGIVLSGSLSAGDNIVFYPSARTGTVEAGRDDRSFTLTESLTLPVGEVICRADQPQVQIGTCLRVRMEDPSAVKAGGSYTMTYGGKRMDLRCSRVNADGTAVVTSEEDLVFDTEDVSPMLSRFSLSHGSAPLGFGNIVERIADAAYDSRNIRINAGSMTHSERCERTGCRGLVVWMTGISGSGKSTIARIVERQLIEERIPAYLMDGDKLRKGLTSDLGFTDADRTENQRRIAEVAALFRDACMVALVATISPFKANRDLAREKAGEDFLEVYVKADFETCAQRDPKQLYKKAQSGGISNFTGKGSRYEEPEHPDLLLDTTKLTPEESAQLLLKAIHDRL